MNVNSMLENYMDYEKWKGKIFMEDEKTCYKDGVNECLKLFEQEKCELLGIIQKKDESIKKLRKKLFDILADYEIGNYDSNTHQFYKDVYDIHNKLMELAE